MTIHIPQSELDRQAVNDPLTDLLGDYESAALLGDRSGANSEAGWGFSQADISMKDFADLPSKDMPSILKDCRDLIGMGAALHLLKPREKAPIASGWSTAPRATEADLSAAYIPGANIGVRLGEPSKTHAGYLHLIDLDIRKPEATAEAWAKLAEVLPNHADLPTVISGSGTGRHFYFFSDDSLSSKKLAKGDGWEIELFGNGKQAVLPPSIHPKTGKPYKWQREIESDLVGLGIGPKAHFAAAPKPAPEAEDSEEWFTDLEPDWDRIKSAINVIRDASDREEWLRIGMALHSVSGGSTEAFDLWCRWSKRCPDKYNERAQQSTWRSFDRRNGGDRVRVGTLFEIAKAHGWKPLDAAPKPAARLTFLSPSDCEAAPSRGYVIKGLVAPGDIGCIFGAPGAGKSLIAPFLAYAVAQGRDAFGMRVKQGGAFYVAAEDPHGMRGRVKALKAAYGNADGFRLVEGVSNLSHDSPDLVALAEAVEAQRPALVILDTLAMSFPGLEENSAEAMGGVVAVARHLAQWGAAVLLVHHDTKAEGGTPRGHSLLNGALDVALHVKRDEGVIRAKLTKNRNGTTERDIAFTIATEDGGTDEDGDVITLPRCRELSSDPMAVKLTPAEAAAVQALRQLCTESDDVSEAIWRDACMVQGALSDSPNPDSRARVFRRVKDSLTGQGLIVRFVPTGRTEMHVRLSDINGLDAFDDLPGQCGQSADKAQCPARSKGG